ncbi:hypothetical protein [Gimesia fumaroli]|uniref:Uncharacterized protein n=1 Tax=Gimesia fumaroli TaxID=2527976 RepID=A0A518IHB7_9PLAN|nr:hypothetical protein [Gimesia fumaroli]QDV52483.1 hypothetical protein Enr17x_45460 [Gimesia fumaroli]
MAWPEISIDDFPPERDDEPSSLRQDIIDELTDHFACALNRELLKNPDEQTAKQRVINQFGNPVKIARQLWLDAMQEKIMSQRILVGISAVMAVCCLAVVGIAWSMMKKSEQVNLKMLERLSALEEQPRDAGAMQMNQQILKQLEQLKAEQAAESSAQEMNPIVFQLVQEREGGKPAAGFKGNLMKYEGQKIEFSVEAMSDETGKLDFGKLPWGKYYVSFKAPWGEFVANVIQITTIPGRKFEKTITCPAKAPEDVAVQFEVNWQNKPTGEDYYLLCDFRFQQYDQSKKLKEYSLNSTQEIGDRAWIYSHDLSLESRQNVYLIDVKKNQATPCTLAADGSIEQMDLESIIWSPTVEILQGQYRAPTIYLLQKNELSKLADINSIESIKAIRFYQNSIEIPEANYGLPFAGLIVSPFKKLEIDPSMVVDKTPSELKEIHGFLIYPVTKTYSTSKIDKPNVWEISIPDLYPITRESGSVKNVSL